MLIKTFNTRAKYYKVNLKLSISYQQEIVGGYFLFRAL